MQLCQASLVWLRLHTLRTALVEGNPSNLVPQFTCTRLSLNHLLSTQIKLTSLRCGGALQTGAQNMDMMLAGRFFAGSLPRCYLRSR